MKHAKAKTAEQARRIFCRAFMDGSVKLTTHCRKRMVERCVDMNDLLALANAGLLLYSPEPDIKTGDLKYAIEHPSPKLKVVFTIVGEKAIRLLTVINDKGGQI